MPEGDPSDRGPRNALWPKVILSRPAGSSTCSPSPRSLWLNRQLAQMVSENMLLDDQVRRLSLKVRKHSNSSSVASLEGTALSAAADPHLKCSTPPPRIKQWSLPSGRPHQSCNV